MQNFNLNIYGVNGSGKSYFLKKIINEIENNKRFTNYKFIYLTQSNLIDESEMINKVYESLVEYIKLFSEIYKSDGDFIEIENTYDPFFQNFKAFVNSDQFLHIQRILTKPVFYNGKEVFHSVYIVNYFYLNPKIVDEINDFKLLKDFKKEMNRLITLCNIFNLKKVFVSSFELNKMDYITEFDFSDCVPFLFNFPNEEEIKTIIIDTLIKKDKAGIYKYDTSSFLKDYNYISKHIQIYFSNLNDYLYYFEKYLNNNHLLEIKTDSENMVVKELESEDVNKIYKVKLNNNPYKAKKDKIKKEVLSYVNSSMIHIEMQYNENGEKKYLEINHNKEKFYKMMSMTIL